MLAFAMTAAIRHHADVPTPPNESLDRAASSTELIRWSVQEIRRIANRLAQQQIQPTEIIACRSAPDGLSLNWGHL
jgi:hypothetical protein